MSKGIRTLVGSVAGFIVLFIVFSIWRGDMIELNNYTLTLLMTGAVIGAIVGYASAGDNTKIKDNDNIEHVQSADELLKLKRLFDAGIITKEEYDKKKTEYFEKL